MECVGDEGAVEGEACLCVTADGCHRKNEVRGGTKAWAEYPEAASR